MYLILLLTSAIQTGTDPKGRNMSDPKQKQKFFQDYHEPHEKVHSVTRAIFRQRSNSIVEPGKFVCPGPNAEPPAAGGLLAELSRLSKKEILIKRK